MRLNRFTGTAFILGVVDCRT